MQVTIDAMQAITLFIAFILSFAALAQPGVSNGSGKVNCQVASTINIPVAYTTIGSTILSSLVGKGNLRVRNLTSVPIAVNWSSDHCGNATRDDAYVMLNEAPLYEKINIQYPGTICIRSTSGSVISSGGAVCAEAW